MFLVPANIFLLYYFILYFQNTSEKDFVKGFSKSIFKILLKKFLI